MGPPGSLHITTLHGSLILLGGLTPPDPPYFAHWALIRETPVQNRLAEQRTEERALLNTLQSVHLSAVQNFLKISPGICLICLLVLVSLSIVLICNDLPLQYTDSGMHVCFVLRVCWYKQKSDNKTNGCWFWFKTSHVYQTAQFRDLDT